MNPIFNIHTMSNSEFEKIMNYSPENQKIFDELVGLCIKGLIVPYIGAGMSAFRFPLWNKYINEKKSCLGEKLNDMNNIDAADVIENVLGRDVFFKDIQNTFGGCINDTEWDKIKEEAKSQAIAIVPELFYTPIITTNFDQIIEKIHGNIPVAFPYNTTELEKVKINRKSVVYKIHGCVSDVQNIVFTKTAYNKVYAPGTPLVNSLSFLFTSFHFLFLGCSLAINNTNEGTKEHYIELWERLQQSGMYHFAILDCVNNEKIKSERRNELENKKIRIRPILYESGKYDSVRIILKELLDRVQKQLFRIPLYKTPFTERKDSIIAKIASIFNNSTYSLLVLTGFGGVGKTRIMSEYAHRIEKETNTKVFWFNAISAENIREQIRQFVVIHQEVSEDESDNTIIFDAFKDWTKENGDYLFLLDNVESIDDIELFLSDGSFSIKGRRHLLMTSRLNEKELGDIESVRVEVLEKDEAESFLQSHTQQVTDEFSVKIAEMLGYLPLALEQASAYIYEEKITYQQYAKLIENEFILETLDINHPEYGSVSVRATWNITMQRIKIESAKELLWLCAYFAPDNIHIQWFVDALEFLPQKLKDDIQVRLKIIVDQLKKYSLVKIENNKISIHRLLQEVIRKALYEEQDQWLGICLQIMNNTIYDDFEKIEAQNYFWELVPHIFSITDLAPKDDLARGLYLFLGYGFGNSNNTEKALEIFEKAMGKESPDTATLYHNQGLIYEAMDECPKALECLFKAFNIRQKIFGKDHPDTQTVLNDLEAEFNKCKPNQPFEEWLKEQL